MKIKVLNETPNQIYPQSQTIAKNDQNPKSLIDTAANERGSTQSILAKKNDGDSLAAFNKQKLQQTLIAARQGNPVQESNREINGITENSVFPKAIDAEESQESVLRRTFEEFAFKAGISNQPSPGTDKSPTDLFVEERLQANKAENGGEYKIFNPSTKAAYSPVEWKDRQDAGTIDMFPTAADLESLKAAKSSSNFDDGTRAAEQVLQAMKAGDGFSAVQLLGLTNPASDLTRALDTVKMSEGNADFQSGFINQLGADNFLKLDKMLGDNPAYGKVLQKSLSAAEASEPVYAAGVEHDASIGQRIAQKADVSTLARLTGDKYHPMSKDFLIAAGERVTTKYVGWETKSDNIGVSERNVVNSKAGEVLQNIAQNKEAALELLQNPEFVKNGLKTGEAGSADDTKASKAFGEIMKAGTSPEARMMNSEKVDNALRVISQTLKNPEEFQRMTVFGQNPVTTAVRSETAEALAEVYQNNTASFAEAVGKATSRENQFDGEDVRTFLATIQPHGEARDRVAAATAVEYASSLEKAVLTGNSSEVKNAGTLAGTFVDAESRTNFLIAKQSDENQEKLAKAIGILGEVGTFYGTRNIGTNEIMADILGKSVDASSEFGGKGSSTDRVSLKGDTAFNKQQETNAIAVVTAYERAAFATANGARPATAEQKQQAVQILQDLQTLNDALPENQKILDSNNRLINPQNANDEQFGHLQNILNNKINSSMKRNAGTEAATDRLSRLMSATSSELTLRTNTQIKRQ